MQVSASSAQAPSIALSSSPVVSCIAVSEAALNMPFVWIGGMLSEPQLQADTMTPAEENLIASWLTADDESTMTGKLV